MENVVFEADDCTDDGFPTDTSDIQQEIEIEVLKALKSSKILTKKKHVKYLSQSINNSLNKWFVSLDASKPWILYWILHSLSLLGKPVDLELETKAIETLSLCKNNGGFSGGLSQIAHLATTYAAINTIAIIGTVEAFSLIDKPRLYKFLMEMKQPDGSFRMHHGGEIDIRGTYCALNVAVLCNLITPELLHNCSNFVTKCQSYEGGLGPIPFVEAHGGYTFCGLAAMCLMNKVEELNVARLTEWICQRQMKIEGGFQGRTNKLVDGCYSLWLGGAAVLLEIYLNSINETKDVKIFAKDQLEKYILACCQYENGGLVDKPGKHPDFYHTCYCLSGLSLCQVEFQFSYDTFDVEVARNLDIVGGEANRINPVHPIHNIGFDYVENIKNHFYK